jgi:long-chain acyl-CoA synthetase
MKTLKDFIMRAREEYKNNVFLKTASKEYTYDEIIDASLKWATYIEKNGIKEGDRVGIIIPKSVEQVKAFYATWVIGGIALPINENSKEPEMKFILEDATPNIILTTSAMAENIKKLYPQGKIVLVDDLDELSKVEEMHQGYDVDREDVSALIYTSGSTGNPKGVMLTHKNLIENGKSVVEIKDLSKKDCLYSILPYWHSFSLAIEIVGVMISGGSIGITENQRTFVADIPKFKPTIILVVPRILN